MNVFAIVIAGLLLFALLRFGVLVEYGADGANVKALVGFFAIRIYPPKAQKSWFGREKKPKKARKTKQRKKKPEAEKPGGLKEYLDLLPAIKDTLGRIRRRLLMKTLTIHLVAADEDPFKAAMAFGRANAVFSLVVPMFESTFRIRRRDIRASADFDASKPQIYVKAAISLAVWEAFYVLFAILPTIRKLTKAAK